MRRARRTAGPDREQAEALALQGLAFLAEEPPRLARFMALTGLDADALRRRAGSPEVARAVLEHLLGDESLLLVFAAAKAVAPETLAPALALLQGAGQADHDE
jgi:hypothetical protein